MLAAMSDGERCGVAWGVCPECPGEALRPDDGAARCARCGGSWDRAARAPCPDPADAHVSDGRGGDGRFCRAHAECARRQLAGGGTLTLGAFAAQAPVFVVPYDARWPSRFAAERAALQPLLAPWLAGAIEHIGSTAIPGLPAKPILDLMAPVASLAQSRAALPRLAALEYHYFPYRAEVMHWLCKPSDAYRTHHLHLVPVASALWRERLAFRDYLRAHAAVAAEYAALKQRLAERHRFDREAYTDGKAAFVARVLELAGASAASH